MQVDAPSSTPQEEVIRPRVNNPCQCKNISFEEAKCLFKKEEVLKMAEEIVKDYDICKIHWNQCIQKIKNEL